MQETRISRRNVLAASKAAQDALRHQKELFENQQAAMRAIGVHVGKQTQEMAHLKDRIDSLTSELADVIGDVQALRGHIVVFEKMTWKERVVWLLTGNVLVKP